VDTRLSDLRTRLAEVEDLQHALRLLQFDQQTAMPAAGAEARTESLATLARILHERQTAPELFGLLDALAGSDDPLVRVARRDADKARRVPGELVSEATRAAADGQRAWERAREEDDFAAFLPHLRRNIDLAHEYAACFADEIDEPYDALLDDYEPGMRTADVRTVFGPLREELPGLIAEAAESESHPPPELVGPFPADGQRRAIRAILERVGFDESSWRLAESAHPFCATIGAGDNRLTTRYPEDVLESPLSSLHEFGHGLYEAQIDPAYARTPLHHGASLTIHESQSRLWEVFVAGREPFWRGAWELLHPHLDGRLDGHDPRSFVAAIGAVRPTLIRVDADPVSYPLHIVLRFDLELALLSGDLAPRDLPAAWRDGMRALLGIEVPDDRHGALQDVHWAAGAFGYFPTYALGTMLAAQLWETATGEIPDLDARIEAGDLAPLREWLRDRIHRHGRSLEPRELIRGATGRELDAAPYLAFARARAHAPAA